MQVKIEGIPFYLEYDAKEGKARFILDSGGHQNASISDIIQFEQLAKLDNIEKRLNEVEEELGTLTPPH